MIALQVGILMRWCRDSPQIGFSGRGVRFDVSNATPLHIVRLVQQLLLGTKHVCFWDMQLTA